KGALGLAALGASWSLASSGLCGFFMGSICRERMGRRPLLLLYGAQEMAQVADSKLPVLRVGSVHLTKDWSPHRHGGRTMSRDAHSTLQHCGHVRGGKLAIIV